jgi:hypothetical protein
VLLNTDYTLKQKTKNITVSETSGIMQQQDFTDSGKMKTVFFRKIRNAGEVYDWNRQFGEVMPKTAGSALYGKLGFEASYKKFSLGSEVMLPAYTNLAGEY